MFDGSLERKMCFNVTCIGTREEEVPVHIDCYFCIVAGDRDRSLET